MQCSTTSHEKSCSEANTQRYLHASSATRNWFGLDRLKHAELDVSGRPQRWETWRAIISRPTDIPDLSAALHHPPHVSSGITLYTCPGAHFRSPCWGLRGAWSWDSPSYQFHSLISYICLGKQWAEAVKQYWEGKRRDGKPKLGTRN